METKTCAYRVKVGGEITSFTTSCTIEKRGGFSKVKLSSDTNGYTFIVGKNAVTLITEGQTEYSFTLAEGKEQEFVLNASGATFKALVFCKKLLIDVEGGKLSVASKYLMNISGNETQIDFTLTVN